MILCTGDVARHAQEVSYQFCPEAERKQVTALHVAAFPDTVRERARRLQAQQLERRVRFEYLISNDQLEEALALSQAWMQTDRELAQLFKNDETFPFL